MPSTTLVPTRNAAVGEKDPMKPPRMKITVPMSISVRLSTNRARWPATSVMISMVPEVTENEKLMVAGSLKVDVIKARMGI